MAATATSPPPREPPPSAASASAARRSKRWIVLAAALAVTSVLVGGLVIWQSTRPSTTPPIASTPHRYRGPPHRYHRAPPRRPSRPSTSTAGKPSASSTRKSAATVSRSFSTRTTPPRTGRRCGQVSSRRDRRNAVPTSQDRARDISHSSGVAGGFGIGLTTLQEDSSGQQVLYGSAVQYDFGLNGYFAVAYPTAEAYSLDAAPLDHEWHELRCHASTNKAE